MTDRQAKLQSDTGDFQIYLSSTLDDLRKERAAAIEILRRHGRVIDSYRAGPEPTVENCLADVRRSQLYVLILGRRYGWVPAGEDDSRAKSITELEYDACNVGLPSPIPRLVFVRTTNPDRFNDDETRPQTAERMRLFRARAQNEQQPYTFDTVSQFTVALTEAAMRARIAWQATRSQTTDRRAALLVAPWTIGQTLRPLPGHPVLQEAGGLALTGGALVNFVLSHDRASNHRIIVTSLVPTWTFEPPDPKAPVVYEVNGAALPPQGFFTPERFTLVLAGQALRGASWTTLNGQSGLRTLDADLLNTDPPREIELNTQGDDSISFQGVVRLTVPGRYALRWRIGFTIAGETAALTTAPLSLIEGT